jgi:low affinity Fe/Cu permease
MRYTRHLSDTMERAAAFIVMMIIAFALCLFLGLLVAWATNNVIGWAVGVTAYLIASTVIYRDIYGGE